MQGGEEKDSIRIGVDVRGIEHREVMTSGFGRIREFGRLELIRSPVRATG